MPIIVGFLLALLAIFRPPSLPPTLPIALGITLFPLMGTLLFAGLLSTVKRKETPTLAWKNSQPGFFCSARALWTSSLLFVAFWLIPPSYAWNAIFIGFGLQIELLRRLLRQIFALLNPYATIEGLQQEALISLKKQDAAGGVAAIDGLYEMGTQAIRSQNNGLALAVLNALTQTAQGLSNLPMDERRFTFIRLLRHIDRLGRDSVLEKAFTLAQEASICFVKLTKDQDVSLTTLALHELGIFAPYAIDNGADTVGPMATAALQAFARTLNPHRPTEENKSIFFCLTEALDAIAKAQFKNNKKISFVLLTQPFIALRTLLQDPVWQQQVDQAVLQKEVDRLLEEYATLESVMHTIPPLTLTQWADAGQDGKTPS